MVIIPSVMALLGDKAWWLPKWLDKILPNVDVEGEKLTRELEATAATPESTGCECREVRPETQVAYCPCWFGCYGAFSCATRVRS